MVWSGLAWLGGVGFGKARFGFFEGDSVGRPATPLAPLSNPVEDFDGGSLSPDGAAEFTSLSRAEIDRLIARGELETFTHGRRVLIAKSEVQRWLAAKLEQTRAARKLVR